MSKEAVYMLSIATVNIVHALHTGTFCANSGRSNRRNL